MKLLDVSRRTGDGVVRLTGVIERTGGETVELFYEYPEQWAEFVTEIADPFVAAMVIPAMWIPSTEHTVEIIPPVSAGTIDGAETYVEAVPQMRPDQMQSIEVIARNRVVREGTPSANVGAFLSLGVDSFYTLLKSARGVPNRSPRITHIIHMRGLQEPLNVEQGTEETAVAVQSVASDVGLPVIFGRTNLRDVFDARWGRYHGAGLASVALSLSGGLGRVLTPSAHAYSNLKAIGCHPFIDPLWSNELTRISVDGSEVSRKDKVVTLVGGDPLAFRHLRVCLKNLGGAGNCGRCQKCIRTALTLHLMGTLPKFETFPHEFDLSLLNLLSLRTQSEYVHAEEALEYAQQVDADKRIIRRLRRHVRRFEIRQAVESVFNDSPWAPVLGFHDWARGGIRRMRGRLRRPLRSVPAQGAKRIENGDASATSAARTLESG